MHDQGSLSYRRAATDPSPSSGPHAPGLTPHPQTYRQTPIRHHRALFLSDMHLGARMCRAGEILDFLDRNTADTLYLVGDIVDNWDPLSPSWTPDHLRVLRKLLDFPNSGAQVFYIPGNHDIFFRQLVGTEFGGIVIRQEMIHEGADGRRYVVVHGDSCDVFARKAPFLTRLGSIVEGIARGVDTFQRYLTRLAGRNEWPGIENAIFWANELIRKCDRFEERLSGLALAAGADGVICGHFHQPALHCDFGPVYANCGDWSSNCTAIVEDRSGRLHLMAARESMTSGLLDGDFTNPPAKAESALAL